VGLNFCPYFISEEGRDPSWQKLLEHIRHFVSLGGADHIALGSDYDGTDLPPWVDRSEKLDCAIALMIKSGLEPALVEKICYKNARAFFARYEATAVGRNHI
jgi:membrane dipeptidase